MNHAPTLQPMDWRHMPLDGRSLIEASAGTGKTWTIALLYLRLIVECGLDSSQIVVCTFTEPAAQELKQRLRQRLGSALRAIGAAPGGAAIEPDMRDWLQAQPAALGLTTQQLCHRIELARANIDIAPISTIHAFCARALGDDPLRTGSPLGQVELTTSKQILGECVQDFWRQRFLVEHAPTHELAMAAAGPGPVQHRLGQIDALGAPGWFQATASDDIARDFARLRDCDGPALGKLLARRGVFTAAGRLRKGLAALHELLLRQCELFDLQQDDWKPVAGWLDDAALEKGLMKGASFDTDEDALIQRALDCGKALANLSATLCHELTEHAWNHYRSEAPPRLRRRQQATFSSLIDDLHHAVVVRGDRQLADRLFDSYPAALIDEFQDTDQRQYEIFDRIWRDADGLPRGRLLLVGDPKQAIYGFRGGDIHAYLRARCSAGRHYSLAVNQRSSAVLIEATNQLYTRAGDGFELDGIEYVEVSAAGRTDAKPWLHHDRAVERPLTLCSAQPDTRLPVARLEQAVLSRCADDITALLQDDGQQIGGRRLQPGDIAVLLPNNRHIALLRRELARRRVPSVGSGRSNVLATSWAAEILLVLHALLHQDDASAWRAALCTRLLGTEPRQLRELDPSGSDWQDSLQWRQQLAATWQRRGVLAVVEDLLQRAAARLLTGADGERALTDLRHLGELLQSAAADCGDAEQLLAWLRHARLRDDESLDGAERNQLRIESDAARVQLSTVHASKGLEYPIVFLPLLWRCSKPRAGGVVMFHDSHGELRVDIGSSRLAEHREQQRAESMQEDLRKLYVALTRARHGCWLYRVDDSAVSGGRPREESALDRLLARALDGVSDIEQALPRVRSEAFALVGDGDAGTAVPTLVYRPGSVEARRRHAATPLPVPRAVFEQLSFTALVRGAAERTSLPDEGSAADERAAAIQPQPEVDASEASPSLPDRAAGSAELRRLAHLRGPRFGDAVHEVFEHRQPERPLRDQGTLIKAALKRHAVLPQAQPGDAVTEVARMLDRCLATPLQPGLSLATLPPADSRAELAFLFPLQHTQVSQLRAVLEAHGAAELLPSGLNRSSLNGLMSGVIDLVFRSDGRFHLLDYKSNWLGDALADYGAAALEHAMRDHHYGLQALIYTVALHRHLRQRIAGYAYETHFGDCWYLFVRAVGLAAGAGIWQRRFDAGLVDAVDRAFGDSIAATTEAPP